MSESAARLVKLRKLERVVPSPRTPDTYVPQAFTWSDTQQSAHPGVHWRRPGEGVVSPPTNATFDTLSAALARGTTPALAWAYPGGYNGGDDAK